MVYLRARDATARSDWAGVQAIIQPVERTLGPLDPIRQLYGEALLRLGQNQLAVAQLQPIARAVPGNREAVRLLAEAQLAGGDAAGAVATLRPLADQPAARADELALMATAARALGDPAAATYEARLKRPAPQALGHDLSDGDAAMRAGNWAGAAQAYARLLAATDGKSVVVLNNMAYAQLMLGNYDQALDFAAKALKLAPTTHQCSIPLAGRNSVRAAILAKRSKCCAGRPNWHRRTRRSGRTLPKQSARPDDALAMVRRD